MSKEQTRGLFVNALSAATALAIASLSTVSASEGVNLIDLSGSPQHDQLIIRYKEGTHERNNPSAIASGLETAARAVAASMHDKTMRIDHVRRMALGADVIRIDRKLSRSDIERLMREIASDPDVEYVELDVLHRALVNPNDPRYSDQWHYYEALGGINAPQAWDLSTGQGVVVAIVDSGHISHADLNGNVVGGYDMISSTSGGNGGSGDGNGRDSDYSDVSNVQHGNHVAGTVAAVTRNSIGVAGVAYDAKITQIRVLGNNGYGSLSDIADGIVWAAGGAVPLAPSNPNPAEVINLSLGGSGGCSSTYQNAINAAIQSGAVVVAAAGNSNANVSGFAPANCSGVIAVAASDRQGNRANYSNYGSLIDVTAPGGETGGNTTNANGVLSTVAGNGYAYYEGTSMAAPHVAGVAALVQARAAVPLTPSEMEQVLKDTARPLPGSCTGGCGAGIVDASAAVASLASSLPTQNVGADFDGDGAFDILWRNTSNGQNVIWRSGNSATQQSVTAVPSQAWRVVGVGDFNGDGQDDILWRNDITGANSVWMSGDGATQLGLETVASQAWVVAGTGDFNGDGKDDILWRNGSTGANVIWRSGDSSTQQPVTAVTDSQWYVAGVGDFNSDGLDDILWRNRDSGANSIWRSGSSANMQMVTAVTSSGWQVAGIGDFNGDSTDDILWRNLITGANSIWKSANNATQQAVTLVDNLDWEVAGIGDYNADGVDDILWRNSASGANSIWRSGNSATAQAVTAVENQAWKVVP
ncbi:S8 family serine peptidase [Luteimonas kalidii]|uniref:S8 family serine peptidase n=1 Tax=Luteimonas kalidii TaxID=3042025 RepID=A0ABT6JS13_9GAMM|nr:S8 family serine peptidase [Luteimonas kalidii]MDH5833387.1 S8 family serine peptidase [Luteimonas kalidii]